MLRSLFAKQRGWQFAANADLCTQREVYASSTGRRWCMTLMDRQVGRSTSPSVRHMLPSSLRSSSTDHRKLGAAR